MMTSVQILSYLSIIGILGRNVKGAGVSRHVFMIFLTDFRKNHSFFGAVSEIFRSAKSAGAGWYDIVTRWERRRGRRVASGGFLVELSDNAVEIFEKKEHPLRKL